MKVRIVFPQIVSETKEVEVTEEVANKISHMGDHEVLNFIWSNMTEQEQSWTLGRNWVKSFLEIDSMASIKILN